MKSFFAILISIFSTIVLAHGGHGHSSSPSGTSRTKFSTSSDAENPFSINFKLRSGYEYGSYLGAMPSINSFFGNDELSINLNYEFQMRQFSASQQSVQQSDYQDQDYNNHFSALVKKTISEKLNFAVTGEYETSQAVRLARMINDYTYSAVNSNLSYKFDNEWTATGNYLFGVRQFPNGTYLTPTSSPSGIGEPIVPNEQAIATEPVTLSGVLDNQNEVSLSYGGYLGEQTLNFEGKYILNNSDLASRKYNAQAFKIAVEKMLFARIFAQASYSIENRIFLDRSDKINVTELGLQKELSARMSILGLARNTQLTSEESSSLWEGYAQLQYAF